LQLTGKDRKFLIGDMVDVIVTKTSKTEGKIDLVLADLADKQDISDSPKGRFNGKGNRKK
ncbi:MAG: hypothetical protein GY793_09830, partial [Proteobacteria bacterium]|nr:hypothetical protein [Pseudomonadota bacterium]